MFAKSENYNDFFNKLKGDLLGGLTSGIIAIPLALAFGVASGLGPSAGLYGAIFLCFIAAIFGGAAVQISGPTAPMTVIVASAVAVYHQDPKSIFAIIVLAGIFQVLIGLSRLSGIVKFVPYPVISGFMSGIGVIIILMQSNPILGSKVIGSTVGTISSWGTTFANINQECLILGVITLLIVFLTPQRVNRIVPSALIALVAGTIVSLAFSFDVPRIPEIPSQLPRIIDFTFSFEDLYKFAPLALTLAIIGAVDSLLTALVIDSVTKTKHNPDKVMLGQGIGNAITGLFGGIIGAGATMRTVVNIKAGGVTRLSAIVHALFLIALLFGLAPLAQNIPLSVLAGILIKVAYDIIDFKFLKVIKFAPRHDLYVMFVVFALTVFYDLIFAVGAGITLSALLFAKNAAEQTSIGVKEVYDKDIMKLESQIEHDSNHKIRIVHIDGLFFFGSSTQVVSHFDELLGTKYLILNYESTVPLDISAIFALEDIIVRLQAQKIKLMIVIKSEAIENQLNDLNIKDQIGSNHIFYDEMEAVNRAKEYLKRKVKQTKIRNKNGSDQLSKKDNR